MSTAYPQMAGMWALVGLVAWALAPSRGRLLLALSWVAGAIPYAAYGLYLRQVNPIFQNWPPQTDVDLGDPLSYLLWGHLVMAPFVALAVWRLLRQRGVAADENRKGGPIELLAVWVGVSALVMYAPGLPTFVHRAYYGSFIAFGILAAAGVAIALGGVRPSRRPLLRLAVALMLVAGVATVVESFAIPLQHRDDYALYFPIDEAHVLRSLQGEAPSGGRIVMNSYLSGLYVPALSGQRTFVGFPFETLDTPRKQGLAASFYQLQGRSQVEAMARDLGIDFVLYGRYERSFGGTDPGALAGWPLVDRRGDAVVYRVSR
jgi:hypothetical protein